MSKINKPIAELTKQEFDEAYNEMSMKFDKENKPYMQKNALINMLIQKGEISLSKGLEFLKE